MSTTNISMDQQIQDIAEEFIPQAKNIERYMYAQYIMIRSFDSYKGNAKKEMTTYENQIINQLQKLCAGYQCLGKHLNAMVLAFLEQDQDSAQKIEAYKAIVRPQGTEG